MFKNGEKNQPTCVFSKPRMSGKIRYLVYGLSWLVVSNINFIFHNIWIYLGCHPSHWRTPSFFRGVAQPPSSLSWFINIKWFNTDLDLVDFPAGSPWHWNPRVTIHESFQYFNKFYGVPNRCAKWDLGNIKFSEENKNLSISFRRIHWWCWLCPITYPHQISPSNIPIQYPHQISPSNGTNSIPLHPPRNHDHIVGTIYPGFTGLNRGCEW